MWSENEAKLAAMTVLKQEKKAPWKNRGQEEVTARLAMSPQETLGESARPCFHIGLKAMGGKRKINVLCGELQICFQVVFWVISSFSVEPSSPPLLPLPTYLGPWARERRGPVELKIDDI